jgi:hypothetical protein
MKIISNKNVSFHSFTNNAMIKSRKNKICKDDKSILSIKLGVCQISSLLGRLLRTAIFNTGVIEENMFFAVVRKKILIFRKNRLLNKITIDRGSKPLRNGIIYINNRLIYGDYWRNRKRFTVNIYSVNPLNGKKEIIIQLNNTRHIHFIQKDKIEKNSIIIGTGDKDNESGIYHYDIKKKKLVIIGKGSQDWRALGVIQKDPYIYWGSDCPDKQNFIYRFHRKKKEMTKVYSIAGPAYYSAITKDKILLIGTTVEDRKKHKACIYASDDGKNWQILAEYKKDIWHCKYFGYGIIEFIQGQEQLKDIYINLKGLKKKID